MAKILCTIRINEPTYNRIVIPALEVIQRGINIEIVPAVSERINCCNRAFGGIGNDGADTPRIVGIPCDGVRVLIDNPYDIALKVLLEVERFIVIDDTANAFLVIVKRNKRIAAPSLAKYLRSVKCVGMLYTVYGLGCAYAVGVVGVGVSIERLKLPALFPRQRMPEVGGRVALLVIGDRLTVICGEKVLPSGIAVGIRDAVLAYDIPAAVIHHCVDSFAVQRFCQKLTELIVGVFRNPVDAVRYLCYAFFLAFRALLYHSLQQRSIKNSAPQMKCGEKTLVFNLVVLHFEGVSRNLFVLGIIPA